MEITSKSLLNPKTEFSLKFFKKPFCYNEKKKFKLYEMPKFKSKFFKSGSRKFNKMGKILFISGPARSGNHLALSLLDSHPEIRRDIGEDDMLRTMFTYAKKNELKVVNNMKKKNLQYLLSMSGEPRWGLKSGFNKWSELNLLREKNLKSKVWSGHQLEGHYHVTDFQNYIPKIYYSLFVNYFINNSDKISKSKSFLDYFYHYLNAKNYLVDGEDLYFKYNYRWCGSGLRRELFYLLKKTKNITCITPIRRFENFYYSYAKTRFKTSSVKQKAINNLWEHWRHKVIDYLILKKKYPNKVIIVRFEDMVKNPRETTKQLCKNLDIQFSEKIVAPTVLGEKTLGNSSFAKKKKDKGKIFKSTINRTLNQVSLPREYYDIVNMINKYSLKI